MPAQGRRIVPPLGAVVNGVAAAQMAVEMAQLAEEIQALMTPPLTPEKIDEIADIIANGVAAAAIGFVLGRIVKAARRKPSAVAARGDNKGRTNATGTITGDVSAAKVPGEAACEFGSCQPVIFATGVKVLAQTDFALAGPLPVEWRRFYRSSDRRPGWTGRGWSSPLAIELALTHGATLYYDERGRTVTLPELAAGERHFDPRERLTLVHHADRRWSIAFADGLLLEFAAPVAGQWRLPLLRQQDANGNAIVLHYPAYGDVGHDGIAPRPLGFTDSAGRRIDFVWQEQSQQQQPPAGLSRGPHPLLLEIRLLPRTLEGVPQPGAVLARYAYDTAGNLQDDRHPDLAAATDAAGGTSRYRYRNHLMVAYTTKEGFTHHQQWSREDAGGRVVRTWCDLPGVLDTRFAYDTDARTTDVTDALGRTVRYHYNRHHEVTAIEEAGPDGRPVRTETTMDAAGRPREVRDALGRTVRYQFDTWGNLTSVADPTGATTRFVYGSGPAHNLPVEIVDALGSTWRTAYDTHGNPVTQTDPLGFETHTAYDPRGLPVAITDALGKTRHLLWDAAGQLVGRTDCSGQTTHYEWDPLGHLAAAIDALGQTTRLLHDPLGRLLRVTQPDGAQQHYRWDADGNLCAYTDAQGATTAYRYDGLGQPVERTDAHGKTLRYDYDGVGRLVRLTNEVGAQYHFVYDSADNLVQESGFDGRTQRYAYNAAGELIAQAERIGWGDEHFAQRTGFARDAAGRLVEKRHAIRQDDGSTRETGGRTRYAYDALGRMAGCENGDAKVAFSYDPLSRLTNETQHHTTGKRYSFTHTYDPLGNRTRSELPAGRTVDWLYYGSGHLHQIRVDGEVLSDIERDRLHRETERSQGDLTSRYGFDPMGRLTEHRVSRNKADATALRDPGRMNANLPDGAQIARQYRYDPAGNLVATRDSLRGDARYQYDPLGRIRAAERMLQGASTTERFDFDPAGNILNPNTGEQAGGTGGMGGAFGREIRDNRIAVYQDLRFQYDVHGNVTERLIGWHTKQDYRYSTEHQVASVTVTRYRDKPALKEAQAAHSQIDSGVPAQEAGQSPIDVSNTDNATIQTTHYKYDPLGRRIEKRDAFGATTFAYDGDLLTWEERGSKATHYLYEPDSFVPLAKIEGEAERGQNSGGEREPSRTYYYHCDQIGAPQELTDEAGRIVWAAKYKVWGEIEHLRVRKTGTDDRPSGMNSNSQRLALADGAIQTLDMVEQPLRFQGQYADGETGLHYNRFRYYDPVVGRFIHEDPIGLIGGENLFVYGPNASSWIDVSGLARKPQANAPQHSSRTNVKSVNGQRPRNHCFAGKTMVGKDLPEHVRGKYPHGVPFNMNGFPDFSRYAMKTVNIIPGNSRGTDFSRANVEAFGKGNPYGSNSPVINGREFTWHHNEQLGKMQLVPRDIHDAVKHTGGFAVNC
ncbi:DUF6531 domain-containing protein [Sphingomonas sp. NCPPB 2930]